MDEIIDNATKTATSKLIERLPENFAPFAFVTILMLIFVIAIVLICNRYTMKLHEKSTSEIRNAYNDNIKINQQTIDFLKKSLDEEKQNNIQFKKENEKLRNEIDKLRKKVNNAGRS